MLDGGRRGGEGHKEKRNLGTQGTRWEGKGVRAATTPLRKSKGVVKLVLHGSGRLGRNAVGREARREAGRKGEYVRATLQVIESGGEWSGLYKVTGFVLLKFIHT